MGILSSIAKSIRKGLGFIAKTAFAPAKALWKVGKGIWDNLSGKNHMEAMARQREQQMKATAEHAKLNAANAKTGVTKFAETTFGGSRSNTDNRKRKRRTGAYTQGLGLSI